jgi:hypothetical protein
MYPIFILMAERSGLALSDIPYNFPYNEAMNVVFIMTGVLLLHGYLAWIIDWAHPWAKMTLTKRDGE